ncbi:MAG: acetyl-CoA carboxylase carboxyltransferase subunit alpha [Alphaproteobacteria bacterium]|nr:acetyl-CoA carboxylase carboxyltransferase subunit alpha [Alphaproteobacteria bacterium]MBP9877003.1 acetyl-CoA carboxylase carboxyltransferase subunit alpha [Alphaproteobacteria bacterium]
MLSYLDFEKPIAELEGKLRELRHLSGSNGALDIVEELSTLEQKLEKLLKATYEKLTPAQKVQVARHPQRPHAKDYIQNLITDFQPLAGDRYYGEDYALIAGLGRFEGQSVAILAQEKGSDTESRMHHNFGMARPEGYRKANRIMDLAEKFNIPVLSFVDTSGAYPGIDAEERGQAEAIARGIEKCLTIQTPFISVVIGEGGSGGAIAIAAADRVYMLEHAIYSVISPEGCASILWRDGTKSKEAAAALNITAQDLLKLRIIDSIISEPLGGAHRDHAATMSSTADCIRKGFSGLSQIDSKTLTNHRFEKYVAMGRQF